MTRHLHLSAALALALGTAAFAPQAAETAPAAKPAAAKKAAKPATPRQQLKSEAEGLALANETVEKITQAQLDISARVLTGNAQCEFNQSVSVQPFDGKPGHFKVGFKSVTYVMVPEETTTGAVRLFDRKNGVMWLQIPSKSMLMNQKVGQRLVDSCTLAEQRTAKAGATRSQ